MGDPDTSADGLEVAALRGRLRGRWKAERREHEREALHERWGQRTIVSAVRESMDRGDHLAFHLPGPRTLTGHITGVGLDYALLWSTSTPVREYAVRLAGPVDMARTLTPDHSCTSRSWPTTPAPHPRPPDDLPPTFQAVLQQHAFRHEQDSQLVVEIGTVFHSRGSPRPSGPMLETTCMSASIGRDVLLPAGLITYIGCPSTRPRPP